VNADKLMTLLAAVMHKQGLVKVTITQAELDGFYNAGTGLTIDKDIEQDALVITVVKKR
jgi:hypothetical protein